MWRPDSWQTRPLQQFPPYPDLPALQKATQELQRLPPLVTEAEIDNLQRQLADAAAGKRFLLQGGDCAESFADCNTDSITAKLKILLKMSLVLVHGLQKPIIRVGRIAGQYAKPRSDEFESRDQQVLPSYRGDLINGADFDASSRTPDPKRLLTGYGLASLTLNYIRALTESGFGDLSAAEHWDLSFVADSPRADEYRQVVSDVRRAIALMQTVAPAPAQRTEFFTCHEALHLHYESALTRQGRDHRWYNLSTHLPWIGMRTADLAGAHVEYMRGISNPVALKVGPKLPLDTLRRLCEALNPERLPGRLTLIHRYGADQIESLLPQAIQTIRADGMPVLWCADPMHGNTRTTANGIKTRRFDDILRELESSFAIHHECRSVLGGVHFEMTAEPVTECLGGASGLEEQDLERAYKSLVDPRLNGEQALEMALSIVRVSERLR